MVKLANPYVNDTAALNDFFPLSHGVWAALEKSAAKKRSLLCWPQGLSTMFT